MTDGRQRCGASHMHGRARALGDPSTDDLRKGDRNAVGHDLEWHPVCSGYAIWGGRKLWHGQWGVAGAVADNQDEQRRAGGSSENRNETLSN
eukprot:4086581-Alexandrium_andersonii.AAC.1